MLPRLALVALLALTACGGDDETNASSQPFGASEMRSAIEGTWTGTLTLDGTPTEATLTLTYQPPASRPACGSRTLSAGDLPVGQSARCIDMTTMGLVGVLTTQDQRINAADLGGDYNVYGKSVTQGELALTGTPYRATLSRNENGTLSGQLRRDSAEVGTATLQRATK